jgi:hypothetical protein
VTRVRRTALGAALSIAGCVAGAGEREIELGFEGFGYRTAATPLNPDNMLGLDAYEGLVRGALNCKEVHGHARVVFRGFVERKLGHGTDETTWTIRQAFGQYGWGSGLSLRLGKQRIAWGSGLVWNPSNRVEPPRNPFNTGLEQEGVLAVRADWIPATWVGVIVVAAQGNSRVEWQLPLPTPDDERRTAAFRARFLMKETDLALVLSGGKNQRSLVGVDLGRDLGGSVSLHAETSLYRGSEIDPLRPETIFFRAALGAIYTRTEAHTAISVEYFYNAEGFSDAGMDAYLAALHLAFSRVAAPPGAGPVPPGAGAPLPAVDPYRPLTAGMGMRRHYLHAGWSRNDIRGRWSLAVRANVGLSDGGVALTPGVGYAPAGNVTIELDAVSLLGPRTSEYRLAPARGSLQLRAKVMF